MSFLKSGNPWNPHYAIPQNHLDAPNRGVAVTGYLARGSVGPYPEMPVVAGKYVPRGTVSGILPSMFRTPGQGEGNLSLGAVGGARARKPLVPTKPSANDPIATFGKRAADALFSNIDSVPKNLRVAALKDVLDAIDPAIWSTTETRARELRAKKKYNPRVALKKSIAAALANQMAKEATRAGQEGQIAPGGLLGLAAYGPAAALANFEATSGLWSSIKSAGKAVGSAAKSVGGAVASGAKAAYDYGKKGISAIGSLACKVTKAPGFTEAAAGASMAAGAPPQAGAKGAETAKGLCSSGSGAADGSVQEFMQQAPAGIPMPFLIGGAALLLIVALK